MSTALAISDLRRDGGTQPRDHISIEVARDYAEAMADGAVLPPVTVFYDGTDYWLADGFHRVEAHGLLDRTEIDADVQQGDRRAAILFSVGANASHGYRRSNLDKRRAVIALLNDEEWREWSDREIARRCSVNGKLVASLRPKLTAETRSEVRTYLDRHGNPSHMKVGAIGKRAPELPVIAGRQAERKPEPTLATSDVSLMATASRITGLSTRNLAEMARNGDIEGAHKDAGSWVFPTPALVTMVEEATAEPTPDPKPEPDPRLVYDHAANAPMMAAIDTIEALIAGPSAVDMLAWWRSYLGAGFADGAIQSAFDWMRTFHAGFPTADQARQDMLDAIDERMAQDVA